MEIKHMTKLTKPGKIRAFFTLEIPGKMVIRDLKLIQNDNGTFFTGTPSREYTDKDGQKKWTKILEILDRDLQDKITKLAMAAYGIQEDQKDQPEDDIPF